MKQLLKPPHAVDFAEGDPNRGRRCARCGLAVPAGCKYVHAEWCETYYGKRLRVVSALIVRNGGLLLQQRGPKKKTFPKMWETPGGKVEAMESAADALLRELEEELGLHADDLVKMSDVVSKSDFGAEDHGTPRDFCVEHFVVVPKDRWKPRMLEDQSNICWFTPDVLPAPHLMTPGTTEALRILFSIVEQLC
jgi:8-oxo-dGTP pyrophosphatase MutT (NUDIX family)